MLGMGFWHIAHYLTLLSGSRKHFRAFGSVQLESLEILVLVHHCVQGRDVLCESVY